MSPNIEDTTIRRSKQDSRTHKLGGGAKRKSELVVRDGCCLIPVEFAACKFDLSIYASLLRRRGTSESLDFRLNVRLLVFGFHGQKASKQPVIATKLSVGLATIDGSFE